MEETNNAEQTGTAPETDAINNPSPSILEQELERENKKGNTEGRTEAEKAAFSLKKNAERARELGIDPAEVLGYDKKDDAQKDFNKDAPLTIGMYEQMQRENARKTALQLAEEIGDVHERELTIKYLRDRIVPSGNAHEDLRFARLAVNSLKNGQIVEEISRSTAASTHASGAGAPPLNNVKKEIELTAEEQQFTRAPFNMTPDQIVKLRKTT